MSFHSPCPLPATKLPPDHTIPPCFRKVLSVGNGMFGWPPGQLQVLLHVDAGNLRITYHVPSSLRSLRSSAITRPVSIVNRTKAAPVSCLNRFACIARLLPWFQGVYSQVLLRAASPTSA